MIDAHRELIGIRGHLRRRCVGARAVGTARIVRQRIAREHLRDARIHGDDQRVAGKRGGVEALALRRGRNRNHLRVAQAPAGSLDTRRSKTSVAAVVDARNHHRSAIGDAEFIADERRDALGLRQGLAVEEIARIERRVAQKLEHRSVKRIGAGARHDIGVAGRASPDFGGHPAGTGVDLFHGIDIEIRERRAAHFRIARIRAIHGEHRRGTALAVDGELLGEIRGAVGIGHGAGREQQQLAEVALVQGQSETALPDNFSPPLALAGLGLIHNRQRAPCGEFQNGAGITRQLNRLRTSCRRALVFDGHLIGLGLQGDERKRSVAGGYYSLAIAAGFDAHGRIGDGPAMVVTQNSTPGIATRLRSGGRGARIARQTMVDRTEITD